MKPKNKPHYVNNKDFSLAVVEYITSVAEAKEAGVEIPKVTDYIARSFLRIAEGLSHRANFIRYTYRDEMVMDAVANCLKAINNYNITAPTRTGNPNAFSYFTQISWYAFLHRIAKEKKQQDIKIKYIAQSPFEAFAVEGAEKVGTQVGYAFVDQLKSKLDQLKIKDTFYVMKYKEEAKERKLRKKREISSKDSDLGNIFGE